MTYNCGPLDIPNITRLSQTYRIMNQTYQDMLLAYEAVRWSRGRVEKIAAITLYYEKLTTYYQARLAYQEAGGRLDSIGN